MTRAQTRPLCILACLVALARPSSAGIVCTTITNDLSTLSGYSLLGSSNPATVGVNNGIIPAATAVWLMADFAPPQIGLQSASLGVIGLNLTFLAGDTFGIEVTNVDENPWTIQLVVATDEGTFMSAATSLSSGSSTTKLTSLGGASGHITSTYLVVSGIVPYSDGDRTAELTVAPTGCVNAPAPTPGERAAAPDGTGLDSTGSTGSIDDTQIRSLSPLDLTLGLSDVAGFSQLSSSDVASLSVNNGIIPAGTAVTLTTDFSPPQNGLQSASVGLNGLNIGFLGGSTFGLYVENRDEDPWTFQLVVTTDQGTFMSAAQTLASATGKAYKAGLGGVGGTVSSVYMVVSSNVPQSNGDRVAEYTVRPYTTSIYLNDFEVYPPDWSTISPATCSGSCGSVPDADCFCDDLCLGFHDCCLDACATCGLCP